MANYGPRHTPITTWIRFGYPEQTPIDKSLFGPLKTSDEYWTWLSYGEIEEAPGQYILLISWKFTQAWIDFSKSHWYQELLANLGAQSGIPVETQVIKFPRGDISLGLSHHNEVRTVYFPASISSEARETMRERIHPLKTTAAYAPSIQHLCPYASQPNMGWIEGNSTWEGQDVVACAWLHKWKTQAAEEKFKTTEWYPVTEGGEIVRTLTLDLFEKDLMDLGALGWSDYHIDFHQTCYIE